MLKELRWYLETALFLSLSFLIAVFPDRVALNCGCWLGRLLFLLLKRRRLIAIRNIAESLPFLERQPGWVPRTPEELARETFENLGCSLVEDCKLYHGRGGSIIGNVQFRGTENFQLALERGKGVAFVTGHCGNWELLALSFGARFRHISVVARRQDNRHLNRVLERIRSSYGNSVIYREGALRTMRTTFRNNGIVGLLIDQAVMPQEGVLVDFLGRPAWTSNLLARLARKTEVALIPAFIHREGAHHVVTFHPEVVLAEGATDVEDTQQLTRCVERYAIEYPAEWYWIHKRWKRVPEVSATGEPLHGQ